MRVCMGICLTLCMVLCAVQGLADINTSNNANNSRLTFATHRPIERPINQWLIKVYNEAFKRLGFDFTVIYYPSKRAGQYSNKGRVDGELSRVHDYDTKFPNLLRVGEHHLIVRFSAFTLDETISLTGWESLKNTNYRICYLRGGKKVSEQLLYYVPSKQLFEVQFMEQAANMLFTGRADLLITFDGPLQSYIKSQKSLEKPNNEPKEMIIHHAGIMQEMTGHAWLYKDHYRLVPQLEKVLKAMKEEKLFEKYRESVGFTSDELTW